MERDGIEVVLRHPDRPLFAEGITKQQLADYYVRMAPFLLPRLRGRPVTVERHPRGVGHGGFFQRHLPAHAPPWLARVEVPRRPGGRMEHAAIARVADLVWWVDQNAVAFHPFPVRAENPWHPDLLVFDLDPPRAMGLEEGFERTRRVARLLLARLEAAGCPRFLKTSGSRGLHLVIPLRPGPGFAEVRALARRLAEAVVATCPDLATLALPQAARGERVFLDLARNAPAQSLVAPWSVRALPGAPVSTPLWPDELDDPTTGPRRWTLANVATRLEARGDPWADLHARALPWAELQARLEAAAEGRVR